MPHKLTYRQKEFLDQFIDIYQDAGHPLHYSYVASCLGIGKITAFELLRRLEKHGLIKAEYQSPPNQRGPGRPSVHFFPTQEAQRSVNLSGHTTDFEHWQFLKDQTLHRIQNWNSTSYDGLLSELLARIPERRSPLIYMTELITALILLLASIQESPEIRTLMKQLQQIGLPHEMGLSVLSGISMFLSVIGNVNRRVAKNLLAQFNRYEETLSQLNSETRKLLGEYTREVVQIVSH